MGNTRSTFFEQVGVDLWWNNDQATNQSELNVLQTKQSENQTMTNANEETIMEVPIEISTLHQKRLQLIAEKKKEFDDLRQELVRQKNENEELKEMLRQEKPELIQKWDTSKVDVSQQTDTFEVPGQSENYDLKSKVEELQQELNNAESIKYKNRDLLINVAELQKELQSVNSEMAAFEKERQEYKTHVAALKDIITVSKQLALMREGQIKELSQKVAEIQATIAEKEFATISDDLRGEYERQLRNIKQLRQLYEERQRADKTERDKLKSQLDEATNSLQTQETKNSELQERVEELEKDNVEKSGTIINLESQLGFSKAECGELRAEMNVINQLFSQILLGFNNGQGINLDKLIKTLEENHDLLTEMVINEECTEISSALPKVLLDLVSQVNEKAINVETLAQEESNSVTESTSATVSEESDSQVSAQQNSLNSASEIVQNLPKVWRVLTELLSHQTAPASVLNENNEQSDKNPCYKSVETPTGPTLVVSVSKTYIRLKNLILEKKSLEKETSRLKQLNTHLETRLQDQEKRLELVSDELSKTWHVVGKMQKQHQHLHTQEKILRYELAQKRKLLNELKEELEYCREKWLQAREKNSATEEQWKQLRTEFASRKNTVCEDLNNSVESGYSDERESSSDDDDAVEFESELSVASPETVPECSSISEILDTTNEPQVDTASVETVVNMNVQELETSGSSSSNIVHNETILKVIQDEISKIETNTDSCGTTSSSHQLENLDHCMPSTSESEIAGENSTQGEHEELQENYPLDHQTAAAQSEMEILAQQIQNATAEVLDLISDNTECDSAETAVLMNNNNINIESCIIEHPTDCLAVSQPPGEDKIVLNGNGSTEEVHSTEETLKTDDLAQNTCEEVQKTSKSPEEVFAAKEERLQRLEQQATELVTQTTNTSHRSIEICTKLEDLHEQYGSDQSRRRQDIDDMYKKLEEDILQTIKKTHGGEEYPSTSKQSRSTDEILAAREERLKRLEEQSTQLVNQATRTSHRGTEISSKLDNLHQHYGEGSSKHQSQIQNEKNDDSLEDKTKTEPEENILQAVEDAPYEMECSSTSKQSRTTEEILAAREERLKGLETESNELANKATKTAHKSTEINSKLDELHQQYGESSKQNQAKDTDRNIEEMPVERLEQSSSINDEAGTSSTRSPEEILARREERLQRMEQEAKELMGKAIRNSFRGFQFCSKLNKLHDRYGGSSESSDEGADDNNNNNAANNIDEEQNGSEEHNESVPESNDNANKSEEDSQRNEEQ